MIVADTSAMAASSFVIEWGNEEDLARANEICRNYRDLKLGLVDATVAAVAERLDADAIATLDLRHFGAITLNGKISLYPRDL